MPEKRQIASKEVTMNGYRVDTVPAPIRPLFLLAAWACGLAMYLYYILCRFTSRISVEGPGNHDLRQHAIFCFWHESWLAYFVVYLRYCSPHALLSHPAAYMKPIHNMLRLMGLKRLVLGSSGNDGKRAANEIARLVKHGFSTTISPDGPAGPAKVLKKGVLHIALQSEVPIVPLTISASHFIRLRGWDAKYLPLPFSHIRVTVHLPISVEPHTFYEARARIVSMLETSVESRW
jgi:lysophospholipid acyltransferase (LPLAT)-like uncharacterized protein